MSTTAPKTMAPGYIRGLAALSHYMGGASTRWIRNQLHSGALPCIRLSRKLILFRIKDIDTALTKLQTGGAA